MQALPINPSTRRKWPSLAAMLHDAARRCEWLPMREAAQLYRVTDETMLSWLDAGAFTVLREGGITWVARNELELGLRRCPQAVREPRPQEPRTENQELEYGNHRIR